VQKENVMPENIETLDQKIRKKAREDLANEVRRTFGKVAHFADRAGTFAGTSLQGPSGKFNIGACLDAAEIAIVRELTPRAEQEAIDAFLNRVDTLQKQVNELRELRTGEE
jgi:hypothetical protein